MIAKGLVLSCLLVLTTAHCAEPAVPIARGTQGLQPFTVRVGNAGGQPLDCQATTAHWYSVALGEPTSGRSLSVTLWHDNRSGEVFILNQHQDRMPVQRFWCGEQGRSWQTRSEILLPIRRNSQPQSIALSCKAGPDRVTCQTLTP